MQVNTKSAERSQNKRGKATRAMVGIPQDTIREMHRNMVRTRRLDEKMLILLKQGKSFFHIGASGHEAVQIALAANMRPGHDWAYPYYRGLAFCMQYGMSTLEVVLCFLS
jgi:2-oxoisovalerate dehydrogenase E1 component